MVELINKLLQIKDRQLCGKIAEIAEIKTYAKDERILKIGEIQGEIRILISGAVRFYYRDEEQMEHTQCFVHEPGYPIMVDAYSESIMSGCDAITQVTALTMPISEGFQLIGESNELMNAYIQVLRRSMLMHAEIAMVLRACDAKRRYMWFAQTFPEIEMHAKSRHIASFLCISPETLSRVRAKSRNEEKFHGQMRIMGDERSFDEIRKSIWKDLPISGS